jgi:hypothetical protein
LIQNHKNLLLELRKARYQPIETLIQAAMLARIRTVPVFRRATAYELILVARFSRASLFAGATMRFLAAISLVQRFQALAVARCHRATEQLFHR